MKGKNWYLRFGSIGLVIVAVIAGVFLTSPMNSSTAKAAIANKAFLEGMVPHHQSAIEMANIGKERATLPEIKQLAGKILAAQNGEITSMKLDYQRLFKQELKQNEMAGEKLGVSMADMGMSMDTAMLKTANPFDQMFIDMMIPHHQGAIRMARAVLKTTKDTEIRTLATNIIAAQTREIALMNDVRKRAYGTESPAGGVPAEGDTGGGSMNMHSIHGG